MSGVICFMVVVAVMVALGLLVLALDELVRFLAGDSEKAGLVAIRELDELLAVKLQSPLPGELVFVPRCIIRPEGTVRLDELGFGKKATKTNPFITEWRWMLVETLSDISHEAGVAASAIEANRPYQEMGGEMRVYRMLRTLERVTSMTLRAIDDPAPELPDLPF